MPDPTDPDPETSIAASSPTFMPAIRPETTSGSRTTTHSPREALNKTGVVSWYETTGEL